MISGTTGNIPSGMAVFPLVLLTGRMGSNRLKMIKEWQNANKWRKAAVISRICVETK